MHHGSSALIAVLFAALALPSQTLAQSAYEISDELLLLPTPREIELTGVEYEVDGWHIILPPGAPRLVDVAADEVNGRLADMGAARLPIERAAMHNRPAIYIGSWQDRDIQRVSSALDVVLTPTDPGEQGYVIAAGDYDGRPAILLGGSDVQGALYAAVTFRRLLRRRDGRTVAVGARVRDWPDFKLRGNGSLDLNELMRSDASISNPDPLFAAAERLKRSFPATPIHAYTGSRSKSICGKWIDRMLPTHLPLLRALMTSRGCRRPSRAGI